MMSTKFAPTKQQADVTNFFKAQFEGSHKLVSIFLNAVAGAGKTSTIMLEVEALMEIENRLGRPVRACSLSFNTNIRDASQAKLIAMGSSVQAKTTNQMGRSILVNASKSGLCREPGKLDNRKYRAIVEGLMSDHMNNRSYFSNFKEYGKAVTACITLISAVRSTRKSATIEDVLFLVSHYNLQEKVDISAAWFDLVVKTVGAAIAEGIKKYQQTGSHDFDDQIILPLDLDVAAPEWDVIFVDEAQDLNRARLEMITRCIKPNGILFFVGDPSQAIQGFTFADTQSVQTIKDVTGAVEFPLSVCFRCDSNIIKIAQELVPHIEARNGAPEGIVSWVAASGYIDKLQSGTKDVDPDLVLSRVKAPLVSDCLAAIRSGKSAIVRGRDIGSSVVSFMDDAIAKAGYISNFETLIAATQEYTSKKIDRLSPEKDELKISELEDQCDTVEALADGYMLAVSVDLDMEDFKAFIESKFSDTTDANEQGIKPIVFSTIHKAKGLEYDRVFIIETKKLPHPMAKDGWQREQEYNIIYVACTRAKHELYFVGDVPACLQAAYNEINRLNVVEVLEEAEEIVSAPVIEVQEVATEEIEIEDKGLRKDGTPRVRAAGGGRKSKSEEEKRPKKNVVFDKDVYATLEMMSKEAKETGTIKPVARVFEELLKENPRFQEALARYLETKDNGPEDDNPGGGAPVPSLDEQINQDIRDEYGMNAVMSQFNHNFRDGISPEELGILSSGILDIANSIPDSEINAGEGQETTFNLFPEMDNVDDAQEPVRVLRRFYTCKHYADYPQRCNHAWAVDYYLDKWGRAYRIDEDGAQRWAKHDATACPKCGQANGYIHSNDLQAKMSESHKCDSRCYNATGAKCTCSCGGVMHGTGSLQGDQLVKFVEQIELLGEDA